MIHNLSTEPHFECSEVPFSQISFSELVFQSALCNFVEGFALFIFTAFNAEELKSNSLQFFLINLVWLNPLYLPSALIFSSSAHSTTQRHLLCPKALWQSSLCWSYALSLTPSRIYPSRPPRLTQSVTLEFPSNASSSCKLKSSNVKQRFELHGRVGSELRITRENTTPCFRNRLRLIRLLKRNQSDCFIVLFHNLTCQTLKGNVVIYKLLKNTRSVSFCPPQVRTLFVSGLPLDIKPRELYLLFRPFKVCLYVLSWWAASYS